MTVSARMTSALTLESIYWEIRAAEHGRKAYSCVRELYTENSVS